MAPRFFTVVFLALLGVVAPGWAQEPLFPSPLHLTREIFDPLSQTTAVVEEYYAGSRAVSIRGPLTAIADYEKGELLEIDRAEGTYSVTRFEEIARSRPPAAESRALRAERLRSRVIGPRMVAGRAGDAVQLESEDGRQRVEITADREMTLSRPALEVLLGTAFPNEPSPYGEAAITALLPAAPRRETTAAGQAPRYRLPLAEVIRIEVEGDVIESRKTITRVGSELPPPGLLVIPPGARLVESALVRRARLLDELDRPSPSPQKSRGN